MTSLAPPSGARWIGPAHPFDLHEAYLDFRQAFNWDGRPATLFLTADSRYRLWVNGNFVCRGPARCWPHAQSVDALDLTPFLHSGRNLLAVQVYQPGYSHFAYLHRGATGVLAWLMAGDTPLMVSDASWKTRRNPSFGENVRRVSIYGSGVEDRDLRQDDDWTANGYDDSGWSPARIAAEPVAPPWTGLELRDLPELAERDAPLILIEQRAGPALGSGDPHVALVDGWRRATINGDGETVFRLYDLGRARLCQGWADVRDARGGETLLIGYAEKRAGEDLVLSDPATYCRMRVTDRFTLRPGDQRVEPFLMRGGRYLLFALSGSPAAAHFGATTADYPVAIARRVQSDDPALQGILDLCDETLRACLHDGFVDSVWRESSQWVGDALPQALALGTISDDPRPLRRIIRMAAQGAYPDGVLPSVVPGEVHAYTVVDYNFIWVELLARYHEMTGDEATTREVWPALKRMLDRFHADLDERGLVHSQPGRRLFLDWAPVSRAEPNAIYNLRYLLALQTAARLAIRLDEQAAAHVWTNRAAALLTACRQTFRRDGVWRDDPDGRSHSQLAASLAVLTGAAAVTEAPTLLDAVVARSLHLDNTHIPDRMVLASPFMHHTVFEALRLAGRDADVVEIIRARWGRWVKAGYPTTWENWNVDFPDGSECHAFSAHPLYHLGKVAEAGTVRGLRILATPAPASSRP